MEHISPKYEYDISPNRLCSTKISNISCNLNKRKCLRLNAKQDHNCERALMLLLSFKYGNGAINLIVVCSSQFLTFILRYLLTRVSKYTHQDV